MSETRSATSGCHGPVGCGCCLRRRPGPAGTAPCGAGRSPLPPRRGPPVGWSAGVWSGAEGGLALGVPAFDQLLDPVTGHVVVAGDRALGALLLHDRGDDQSGLGHGGHLHTRCQLCPETGANYVVEPDTVSPTKRPALTCGTAGQRRLLFELSCRVVWSSIPSDPQGVTCANEGLGGLSGGGWCRTFTDRNASSLTAGLWVNAGFRLVSGRRSCMSVGPVSVDVGSRTLGGRSGHWR